MNAAERQLIEDRAVRDAAREVVTARLARLRGDLAQRSVASRLGDEALGRARQAGTQALDVARDYRWILAGTGVAVAAWMFQAPLLEGARFAAAKVRARVNEREPPALWRRLREWSHRQAGRLKRVRS